jgi:alginate O-acetyltransferase complex protein AlgJ
MSDSPYTKRNREEIAEMEVGNTSINRSMSVALVAAFILTIVSVPLTQHLIEIRAGFAESRSWVLPAAYKIFNYPPQAWAALANPANGDLLSRLSDANGVLMSGFKSYEEALESDSFIARAALPHAQAFTAEFLGLGNEQVHLGRERWLFYQPDVAYLTGPGFLNSSFQRSRARSGDSSATRPIQPDPLKAIVQFRDQLKSRGIHLVIMPIPVKPMIEPEFLSRSYRPPLPIPLQNPSYGVFLKSLEKIQIDYLDVSHKLAETKSSSGRSQFLRTDTHWTPQAMQHAVALLAEKLSAAGLAGTADPIELDRSSQIIHGIGDVVAMLKLPATSRLYPREAVTIHPVRRPDGKPWSSDPRADILILGDSFFNIFSLEGMGWGASAGFVEQLSHTLRRPVDAIIRNGAGALATRELLGQELARGRDRLNGKRLVVWEFAVRELATGNWDLVTLKAPARSAKDFLVLEAGERQSVNATVKSLGTLPRPGMTPYKDYLTAFHLAGIEGDSAKEAIVYLQTMKNQQLTPAARLRPGDSVSLLLTSWTDAEPQYGGINRGELEDENLMLEEPNFAELAP